MEQGLKGCNEHSDSDTQMVSSSAPQGSIPEPVLFHTFIMIHLNAQLENLLMIPNCEILLSLSRNKEPCGEV